MHRCVGFAHGAPRLSSTSPTGSFPFAQKHSGQRAPYCPRVVALYTTRRHATVIRADELGLVVPRNFPPGPGWSAEGHRIKAELDYFRRQEIDLGLRRVAAGRQA